MALELSEQQLTILQRLVAAGFTPVAWPLYANYVGVRKGNCGALLAPTTDGKLSVFGSAFCLVEENPAVRVSRGGRTLYVFKKAQLEATPELEAELADFRRELGEILDRMRT
jgi:hypothetical protein